MITNSPKSDAAKQKIIDDLLKEVPTDTTISVDLPSECRVYTLEDEDMPVTVRPMTFEDEKAIVGAKKNDDPVNLVLQRCVTNVKVMDLLPG